MKSKLIINLLFVALVLLSCAKSVEYSEDFKSKTEGKYRYNANEIIEVMYEGDKLFVNWRGGKLGTIPLSETEFFVADMNKKLRFVEHPTSKARYLSIVTEDGKDKLTYDYLKMSDDYKTPSMHLKAGNYDLALKGYLEIKERDSLSPFLNEWDMNRLGYQHMNKEEYEKAIAIFKINTKLHPTSDNVYDSLADAYLRTGDSAQAYNYYKKALEYNTGNRRAKRFLEIYKPNVN